MIVGRFGLAQVLAKLLLAMLSSCLFIARGVLANFRSHCLLPAVGAMAVVLWPICSDTTSAACRRKNSWKVAIGSR